MAKLYIFIMLTKKLKNLILLQNFLHYSQENLVK